MLIEYYRLSAKDKIAVCGGPADAVLRVMHIPTGECLSLIENCASPVMRYSSGVFFHSTAGTCLRTFNAPVVDSPRVCLLCPLSYSAAHLLVAVNLRDGETMTLAGHSDLITDVAVLPDVRNLVLLIWCLI